jgi:hypothetical protein
MWSAMVGHGGHVAIAISLLNIKNLREEEKRENFPLT